MFSIYQADKQHETELHLRKKSDSEQRFLAKAKIEREHQVQQYKQRVACFIKEMITDPVVQNDKYTQGQEDMIKNSELKINLLRSFKKQKRNDLKPGQFRFMDTKEDRIKKGQSDAQYFDLIPNTDINQCFNKILRRRNRNQELGPELRFQAKNTVERVYDEIKKRDTLYLQSQDITNLSLMTSRQNAARYNSQFHPNIDSSQYSRSDQVGRSVDKAQYNTQLFTSPKNILPGFHRKTHFKAAVSVFNREPGTLNIEDGSVDHIFQDVTSYKTPERASTVKVIKPQTGQTTLPKTPGTFLNSSFQSSKTSSWLNKTTYGYPTYFKTPKNIVKSNKIKIEMQNYVNREKTTDKIYDDKFSLNKSLFTTQHQENSSIMKEKPHLDYNLVSGYTKEILKRCSVIRRKNLQLIQNSTDLVEEMISRQ